MKKTAIVTGGSRGIGLGIVKQLGKDGFAVVITAASPEERHRATLEELTKNNIEYLYVQGNIADHNDRMKCVDRAIEKYGRIDVLVNNAGVAPKERNDILNMTEESYDYVMNTNTKGTMFMTQYAANKMIQQEPIDGIRGIIVNVSSISAEVSSTNRGEYCVSKAGISMLTKLYADRLASEDILVYEIRPGIIETDMTSTVKEKYDRLFAEGVCPIKRWGTPEDIGLAVSALCSGKFRYTTGQCIFVDGGFHIQRL
ncbi:MAG: 3-ketoacyl-ACP reductase [Clostridiaceae bacterium]|nr:3-ketoacyl-ACP reductase [Clostridiaceae bacterium]